MIVRIDKRFEKDTDRLKDKKLLTELEQCIGQVMDAEGLDEIPNLKKLQ